MQSKWVSQSAQHQADRHISLNQSPSQSLLDESPDFNIEIDIHADTICERFDSKKETNA